MKLSAKVVFNVYMVIAILTIGYALAELDGRIYKTENEETNAVARAVTSGSGWPLYWSYKGFLWLRKLEVTEK